MQLGLKFILFISVFFFISVSEEEWGFYAHRKINEMAVYTLPPPLIKFYKNNIRFIADHAVDADMRRHASPYEAVRHYIDIDFWGEYPYPEVPRKLAKAVAKYASFKVDYGNREDSIWVDVAVDSVLFLSRTGLVFKSEIEDYFIYFSDHLMADYYEEEWIIKDDMMSFWPDSIRKVQVLDLFSTYGILPYSLSALHRRLTNSMIERESSNILKISADLGHYISDAHVPLHTTINYNGQLTGQDGIHAFWESRIPELFAEDNYDFFVGKAEYVADVDAYIWKVVLESNLLVDSVLMVEEKLRETFPLDQQYCYDERGESIMRQPCPAFAKAYQDAMQGMVENQMRKSIKALGDLWYTSWINAGQPELSTEFVLEATSKKDTIKESQHLRINENE